MSGPASSRHLVLVGLMGAGKSSVGATCARRLGRGFVDTDAVVVAAAGRSIAQIFAEEGEDAFRERERIALADACAAPDPLVIACGGGAVLDPANRSAMRAAGLVVWLRAAPSTLADRVGDDTERPLLAGAPALETLERLAAQRADAYRSAAHVVVDTDGLDAEAVAARVLQELDRCAA